jgi:hypothetical protein
MVLEKDFHTIYWSIIVDAVILLVIMLIYFGSKRVHKQILPNWSENCS